VVNLHRMFENAEHKPHLASLKVEWIEISYHVETLGEVRVRLESTKLTRHELSLAERSCGRVILNDVFAKRMNEATRRTLSSSGRLQVMSKNRFRVMVESIPVNV